MRRYLYSLVGTLLILFTNCSTADSLENYKQGLVLVNKQDVLGCPDKKNMPACFPVRWGRWLLLKEGQKISSGKSQWIEIQSSASGISEWWIKREDVVLSSEMKAYNKPLPVKSFRYDAGHLRMHFEFLKSGEAYVHWKGKKDVAQIFYAPDVLEVRYPAPTYEYSEIIGFKNDKVYPTTCVTGELCEVLYH